MWQELSSVPARLRAALRMGPTAVVALGLCALLAGLSACGQRGALYLPEGKTLQRPSPRPVTSPPTPPALSPTDTPATLAPLPAPTPASAPALAPD